MKQNTRLVLNMVANGKISPEEGGRLLDKLKRPSSEQNRTRTDPGNRDLPFGQPSTAQASRNTQARPQRRALSHLRIIVKVSDGERINLRLPLGLLRNGINLPTLLPEKVCRILKDQGICLGQSGTKDTEAYVQALRELDLDLQAPGGIKIRMCCE